jgi:hypothetical protein
MGQAQKPDKEIPISNAALSRPKSDTRENSGEIGGKLFSGT